jgi:hypothetical protein
VFVDILGLDLTPYIGGSITILDAASKPLVLSLNALGTGETYSAELTSGWSNYPILPYSVLTTAGVDIVSAIDLPATTALTDSPIITAIGELIQIKRNVTVASGEIPNWSLSEFRAAGTSVSFPQFAGPLTVYNTLQMVFTYANHFNVAGPSSWSMTGYSLRKVLTPSVTGATATIISQDAAFDPNSATGFTYSILTDNWNYRMGQQGFFKSS